MSSDYSLLKLLETGDAFGTELSDLLKDTGVCDENSERVLKQHFSFLSRIIGTLIREERYGYHDFQRMSAARAREDLAEFAREMIQFLKPHDPLRRLFWFEDIVRLFQIIPCYNLSGTDLYIKFDKYDKGVRIVSMMGDFLYEDPNRHDGVCKIKNETYKERD